MRRLLNIPVKESVSELKQLQKRHPGKFKVLQMLLLMKKHGAISKNALAELTGASDKSIQIWRTVYSKNGIATLLIENRRSSKKAAITEKVHEQLSSRLNDPKAGFRSFIEIQQWLEKEFNIIIEYHAVNKYVKRKFGAKLKVSRKSHVQKSPADEVVFKKPVRKV